ncbi:unnamed protein product [Rhizophagus irregularis]|nr:unnamed protein product [Rhizophagus irregularis]
MGGDELSSANLIFQIQSFYLRKEEYNIPYSATLSKANASDGLDKDEGNDFFDDSDDSNGDDRDNDYNNNDDNDDNNNDNNDDDDNDNNDDNDEKSNSDSNIPN